MSETISWTTLGGNFGQFWEKFQNNFGDHFHFCENYMRLKVFSAFFFCLFPTANVLNIMGKGFPWERVILPKWFGNLAKPLVFTHKLVT